MELFDKESIKKYANTLGLTFADTVKGMLTEELCYLVLPEKKPVEFALESNELFGADAYKSHREKALVLWTKEDRTVAKKELLARIGAISAEEAKREDENKPKAEDKAKEQGWTLRWIWEENPESQRILLTAELSDMKIPFSVEIRLSGMDQLYLQDAKYMGIGRKKELTFCVCAPEQRLAEDLALLMERLELIPGMESYERAGRILKEHAVNGRRVSEELRKLGKDGSYFKNRTQILKGYETYKYMEKRYVSYLKNKEKQKNREKMQEPLEWQECIGIICGFLEPISQALMDDLVFIGDWMPELGRFI